MTPRQRVRLAWAICASLIAYTAWLYVGLGPVESTASRAPWQPSGFLRELGSEDGLLAHPALAIALLSALPAAGSLVVLSCRTAVAFALSCSCFVTCLLLGFYGLTGAFRVWSFFGWRGSWVIVLSGLAIGVALAAPLLAARWWRLPVVSRVLVYAPFGFAVLALIRNVTGTDERLPFNLSPWPAITVLALEIVVYTIVGVMIGGAVAAISSAQFVDRPALRGAAIGASGVLPVAWFAARFDHTGVGALLAGLAISIACVAAVARVGASTQRDLEQRAGALALAAALIALPLLGGSSLAEGDHVVSRHVGARAIIDALAAFYDEHGAYPDDLGELVEQRRLERLPVPRVGFALFTRLGWTDAPAFRYQNLGSSYLLEFASTEWVMCSYSPAWRDLDEGEDVEDDAEHDDATSSAHCHDDCTDVCERDCDPDRVGDCDAFCTDACRDECTRRADEEATTQNPSIEAWACPAGRPELW